MRPTNVLVIPALLGIFAVSGCATTEYIEVRPYCSPPPEPAVPILDKGELWDALGDDRYRVIERYINGVWAYADEQAALLGELCGEANRD